MSKMVVGFAFNLTKTAVALILKARPAWQKGKFNGIGGHIEDGESPLKAMNREWDEEASNQSFPVDWTLFTKLCCSNGDEVFFYRGNTVLNNLKSSSPGEQIVIFGLDTLPENIIPNLSWLIPMAQVKNKHCWVYNIMENVII